MRTSTTDKPIILVTGATGAQGGGVARALLADGRWAVRGLTRNPASPAARALAAAGAQVVGGDLADPASVRAALRDVHGVFGITSFWEHFEGEYQHGRNLVEAVAAADVRHFVFSTLAPIHRETNGELSVPHFDIKARLEDETRALGLPATFIHVTFYYENFVNFLPPRRQADGRFVTRFPQGDVPLGAVSVEDVGGVVAPLFAERERWLGKVVKVVGDERTVAEYVDLISRATGQRVEYAHMPPAEFAALGFPGADDLAAMFDYYMRYMPRRDAEIAQCRTLNPSMRSFAQWIARRAELFHPVLAA